MDKIPIEIKRKLKKLHDHSKKLKALENEAIELIESYGVDIDFLTGTSYENIYEDAYNDRNTDAFTYISYGEGDFDEALGEFEKVFLLHANK